ncbi:hypothetical protein IFJ82_13705 [Novacetimonas hansenii]|uniref:Uncharacterized protein n=2 Tax=Novacetimonas hansenii TaxID=436 RepID=A0AAW5ESF1_NOVHA|nr:hypothetical protein [Novacetimonas hansenii]EFG85453.1 hypothetical protein GXY_03448 [Novacetimonas hansenii ATCC 23769]MBL7237814.1 hypothetical protein [Novacetimonas hansenii]MCJ8353788.1 hypothetical protein [Novacetimonas hansenii]PYD72503.1 hypothetical protein CFR74_09260 [Novacetimonas hansenii]QOF94891.1 hypothetical protein IFJ82_13705 [Novacetimonas hansenii]
MSDEKAKDASGNVVVYPTVSCGAEAVQGTVVILDLFMATSPEHLKSGDRRVVTALHPEQALHLAQQLQAAAETVLKARKDRAAS